MKTEKQYVKEWKELGLRFGYGHRVCRHITNSYKDKYSELDYKTALIKIRKEAEKKLVEVNREHKFAQLELVRVISRNINSLTTAEKVIGNSDKKFEYLKPMIRKVGYLKAIINACYSLTPDQLKEWAEHKF